MCASGRAEVIVGGFVAVLFLESGGGGELGGVTPEVYGMDTVCCGRFETYEYHFFCAITLKQTCFS